MAGFDPMNIMSEMVVAGVGHCVTTPPQPPTQPERAIVAMTEEPTPLEMIAPGEPGNLIDVENPPNFHAMNWAFPPSPLHLCSKKYAGVDPDYNPTKNYKSTGESSTELFILDPDFSYRDDSEDRDYELVARPENVFDDAAKSENSKSVRMSDSDDDMSLVAFLLDLNKGNTIAIGPNNDNLGDEVPDE